MGSQDLCQRATLGIVAISDSTGLVDRALAAVAGEVERVEPGLINSTHMESHQAMQGSRAARIGDQIRAELSDLLRREVKDPGVGFVTLTEVRVTPDLQIARVYYTTLGDQKARAETKRALDRAMPFLRRQIGQRLRLRRVPELEFFFDESIERADRIERIIQELHGSEQERHSSDTSDDE